METVVSSLQWEICLIYLDDIIIFARDFNTEMLHLRAVFQRLRSAGLRLKAKKCRLFQRSVVFLGHVVSAEGVSTDPDKVAAVRAWPTPQSVTEVRSFLGLASYYRRYIRGYASIAKCLHKLTEKNKKFVWTDECSQAFDQLKQALTEAPILSYPTADGPYILDTDACDVSIGAVLSQQQEGHENVISYASRSFTKPKPRYCVTRKEMLSLV
jgi:hypothetical protein